MRGAGEADPPAEFECSVVIPTHRGAHRLPLLLDALSTQDYIGKWELVVVVDGVLDGTVSLLDSYRDRLPLVVVVHNQPRGVVATMNEGITAARGRIVMRCDDDLTPQNTLIRVHMAHHNGTSPIAVIGPTRDVFANGLYARAYGIPATERSLAAGKIRDPADRWVGWAANNSVSRQVLVDLGGFDPRFVYGQDSELGYRIAQLGVQIVSDPELESQHRAPSMNVESRASRAFVSGASRKLFDRVHKGARDPSPQPSGIGPKVWDILVFCVARMFRTRDAFGRVGRRVDGMLSKISPRLAARIISLLVEAAGNSGRIYGSDDLAMYKLQKVAELSRELTGR
jgi:glycosyltransferase involved in cell wall biosynthesis